MKKTMSLEEALKKAKAVQPRLAAATNELNEKIKEFEKALTGLKLGVIAQVRLFSDDLGPWGKDLCFQKWGDAWRLVVEDWNSEEPEEHWSYEVLQNTSRETRLRAVEKFPELVVALVAAAEAEIVRVTQSSEQVAGLVGSLDAEGKS